MYHLLVYNSFNDISKEYPKQVIYIWFIESEIEILDSYFCYRYRWFHENICKWYIYSFLHVLSLKWKEVIASWLTEARWSKTGEIPSIASYMETGSISIAAHLIVLEASCFLTPSLPPHKLNPSNYEDITQLLMISCRLLNDLQSYEVKLSMIKFLVKFCWMLLLGILQEWQQAF